ncbi:hypothetical protein MAC_07827 [Metarhizium acridum CQMa 102]|uniref:Zn(II)2Cys6 transcription factor n=1 Tax=Metarhizium acridum (strain CQMa 102) TaxID=655827 RepID=E9ED79_METAQ|nr:uncharacterized protein MAC_07827 [Metarhizium acridum CQMa 102]EFY86162.1 hypothetical protein MAC_07827 [Metarhizium acridum CQMa 102]
MYTPWKSNGLRWQSMADSAMTRHSQQEASQFRPTSLFNTIQDRNLIAVALKSTNAAQSGFGCQSQQQLHTNGIYNHWKSFRRRCILRSRGGSCERCHRLGKDCHQIETTRKRVAKKTASSRTAQLEEKIEDLVSMLRATHDSRTRTNHSYTPLSNTPSQPFASRLDSLAAAATADPTRSQAQGKASLCAAHECIASDLSPSRNTSTLNDADRRPEPTPEEAEAYFAKPFLWMCIMNLTSMSIPQQRILREKIRREVADRLVFEGDRSMDILQGLVAFLTWATMNAGPGMKPFLILYATLAQSIVFDMGLTRSPAEEQQSTMYFKTWSARPPPPPRVPRVRTMEERRVVLGLWLAISITTSFIGKMETLAWTAHMDDSLAVLEHENEYPSDAVLATMVKIQLVGEEAQRLMRSKINECSQNPTYILKPGLVSRLNDIRSQLPDGLANNRHILLLLHCTESLVHSIGLFTEQGIPEPVRINSMYSCTKHAKAFYDIFFAIPAAEVAGLPFAALTTVEDKAWDKDILKVTADLLSLLDKTIELFYRVDEVYPIRTDDHDGTLFTKGAKILRNLRASWEPILAPYLRDVALPTPKSQGQAVSTAINAMDEAGTHEGLIVDGVADPTAVLDLSDMTWMSDIFGPWDY